MAWGPQLKFLNEIWSTTGLQPNPLKVKPELEGADAEVYTVFRQLSSARIYTEGGPQPIPVSELLAYCELMRIRELDQRQALLQIVQTLDATFIEHQVRKIRRNVPPDPDGHRKSP